MSFPWGTTRDALVKVQGTPDDESISQRTLARTLTYRRVPLNGELGTLKFVVHPRLGLLLAVYDTDCAHMLNGLAHNIPCVNSFTRFISETYPRVRSSKVKGGLNSADARDSIAAGVNDSTTSIVWVDSLGGRVLLSTTFFGQGALVRFEAPRFSAWRKEFEAGLPILK